MKREGKGRDEERGRGEMKREREGRGSRDVVILKDLPRFNNSFDPF